MSAGLPLVGLASTTAAQTTVSGVRAATFRSRDRDMNILVMEPTERDGPMLGAAVLLLHGSGGLRSDFPTFQSQAARLAALGYLVTMPNYFSNARDPASQDDTDWWRQAVVDAANWTTAQYSIQPGRLGAIGYSRGGYLAAEVAVQETEIQAVVGIASAGNVRAAQIRRQPHILLISAERDPIIPPARTRRWAQRLRAADVPVETLLLDTSRHQFDEAQWTFIFASADTFFRRTLTGRGAAD